MFKGIMAIIFLGAAVAIFFALSWPLYGEIQDISTQNSSLNETLANSKQVQEKRDELISQYNKITQDDLDRLNKILPVKAGSMEYVSETETLAKKYGLLLKNIDFNEKKENTVSLSLKFTGPYESFYSFLKDLEKNIRLTDISGIDFISSEVNSYEFSMDESIYWKGPATSTGQLVQSQDILGVLSLLNTISLNPDFFGNPVFASLADFSTLLSVSPTEVGKSNPFAP